MTPTAPPTHMALENRHKHTQFMGRTACGGRKRSMAAGDCEWMMCIVNYLDRRSAARALRLPPPTPVASPALTALTFENFRIKLLRAPASAFWLGGWCGGVVVVVQ